MSDLDSFFAKKDKKKLKGRKYDNPDDIGKRLQESEKRLEKDLIKVEPVKKLDESSLNSIAEKPKENLKKEEEEWNEFKDDSQKDLSDLKISKLQIENDDDYNGGYGSGEDGEAGSGRNNAADGVWNRNIVKVEDVEEIEEVVAPPPVKQLNTKYVAPGRLNSSMGSAPHRNFRKSKAAPDITNAEAFPSLSNTPTGSSSGPWGRRHFGEDRGFENVRHGSTKTFSNDYAPIKLSTANRFDALSDS